MAKSRLPGLNYLSAFEAAARHGSIKAAADELHVTHSAVSRNIRNLERQLGRSLFERRHRHIRLTSEGEILFSAVYGSFSSIRQAIAQFAVNRSSQRLTVLVDSDFAGLWLVPRLGAFQASLPNLLIEIRAESGRRANGDARVDCAIQYFQADAPPTHGEILFRSRLFPVCSPEFLRRSKLQSHADLGSQTLLFDRSRMEWRRFFREAAIKAELGRGLILNQTAHCMDAAARGDGVALGDDFLAEIYLSEGRLVKMSDNGFMSRNAYYFMRTEGMARHPLVNAFRKWLLASISQVQKGGVEPIGDSKSRKRGDK